MTGPEPPFVELGFYFGPSLAGQMARVLAELLELAGQLDRAYSHSRADSERPFHGPTDYVQEPMTIARVADLESSARRVVSVRVAGFVGHRPNDQANLTYGRIPADSMQADHPILLWVSGDEVDLAIDNGRRSKDYPAIADLFDTLVSRLDPFYGEWVLLRQFRHRVHTELMATVASFAVTCRTAWMPTRPRVSQM